MPKYPLLISVMYIISVMQDITTVNSNKSYGVNNKSYAVQHNLDLLTSMASEKNEIFYPFTIINFIRFMLI